MCGRSTWEAPRSYFNAANNRKFGSEINGAEKEASLDIVDREVGRDVALELVFPGVRPVGSTYPSNADVTVPVGQNNMQVYKTERFARDTTLTYMFTLTAGKYKVETMHAESFFTAPNKREFEIKVNSITFEMGIDLFASFGKDAAVKTFDGIQTDGDDTVTFNL